MYKKRLFFISLFLFMVVSLYPSYAYSVEKNLVSLDLLIEEALENNPQVQVAYNNWKAAQEKIKQVSSLPDPTASFSYFGENVETKVGPQQAKYGLSQKIPFPGKLNLKGKAAQKHAQMMKEKYEVAKREIVKKIKFTYYDIWWVDKATQITEGEKDILESLEKVTQRKYESNLTPQQDVIKAQVELSKLIDKLFLLRQNRKSLEAKINSILDRPRGTELDRLSKVEALEFKYELNQLHKMALDSRQELLAANLDIEKAEYEKSLARLNYFPDFTFGVDYIQVEEGHTALSNDGQDAWLGMVKVNIPIWFDKLGAQAKEKKANLESSKKNYQNVKNNVEFEIEDLYFKITTYKDIISLYKTALIPQTEQAFEAARTGYETGKVDFLNWLESERALLQTRLAYYKTIVDYQKSIAYLERIVGRDL